MKGINKHIKVYVFPLQPQMSSSLSTAVIEDEIQGPTLRRMSIERQKELYVETLSPKEKRAYLIAKEHLGMSFTLEKSVGFLEWQKTQH